MGSMSESDSVRNTTRRYTRWTDREWLVYVILALSVWGVIAAARISDMEHELRACEASHEQS
jgi:uncharacterized protein CbrC (UPF0167 family)